MDELEQEEFDKKVIGIPEPNVTLPEVPADEMPEKIPEKKKATAPASTAQENDGKYFVMLEIAIKNRMRLLLFYR